MQRLLAHVRVLLHVMHTLLWSIALISHVILLLSFRQLTPTTTESPRPTDQPTDTERNETQKYTFSTDGVQRAHRRTRRHTR